MSRILVTGATGFIGGHVVAALRDGRREVIGTARGAGADAPADLAIAAEAKTLVERVRPTAIVHAAGLRHGDKAALEAANAGTTGNLLSAAAGLSPRPRVVLVGSAAEYGRQPTAAPLAEDAECRPDSPYGRAKLAATRVALHFAGDGLDVTVLRVFNVVGPGAGGLPGALIRRVLDTHGDREGADDPLRLAMVRDFVAIADVVRAARRALDRKGLPRLVNVCTGTGRSFAALRAEIAALAGVGEAPVAAMACDDVVVGDPALCEESLGFRPGADLTDALKAAIEVERTRR